MIKQEDLYRLRSDKPIAPRIDKPPLRTTPPTLIEPPRLDQTKQTKYIKRLSVIGLVAFCLLVAIVAVGFLVLSPSSTTPITNLTDGAVNFPLYYPKTLPKGYYYVSGSSRVQNNIAFFNLRDGSETLFVSEQAEPSNTQNIGQLAGFKSISTQSGPAYVGSALGNPTAIIVSTKTLMTLRGSTTISTTTLSQIAKDMALVKS